MLTFGECSIALYMSEKVAGGPCTARPAVRKIMPKIFAERSNAARTVGRMDMSQGLRDSEMTKYDFTLILKNSPELTEHLADQLYGAGCDDGTPGSCCGVTQIDFHREASSLEEALRSAIAQVSATGCIVERVELDPQHLHA